MSQAPNILLIWTDEQRADSMACYGNTHVRTPHLNRLAERSFVWENAYCAQPVCTPSRATILSGQWPHTHGCIRNNVPLRPETATIAEHLSDDYHCAYYGKWHLGDEIAAQHGFSEWLSVEDGIYREFYSQPALLERFSDYHDFLLANGFAPDSRAGDGARVFSRGFSAAMAERYTKASFLGDRAATFISRQDQQQPWFLSVNFLEPHMPFFGPLNDLYDPDTLPVGPAFNTPPPSDHALRNRLMSALYTQHGHGAYPLTTEADWRRLRANYWGLVSLVDSAVGQILAALTTSGQADNTIIVFTSDHGEMMGDHQLLAKCVMYEESIRIPWLMHVPWLGTEQVNIPGRVSQIDLAPTILDLAGQTVQPCMQGESRSNVLAGEDTLAKNDVVVEWNEFPLYPTATVNGFTDADVTEVAQQEWRTIVSHEGLKLNCSPTDQWELFDLNTDPHEQINLVNDPASEPTIDDLYGRIHAWQAANEDHLNLTPMAEG